MLKKDKNFRISKQTKRTMATFVDPVARHAYKNAMIQIQKEPNILIRNKKLKTLAEEHALFQKKINLQLENNNKKYDNLIENDPSFIIFTKLQKENISNYNKKLKIIIELEKEEKDRQIQLLNMYNITQFAKLLNYSVKSSLI